MLTRILDGRKMADQLQASVAAEIKLAGVIPKLAVIMVGDDPASAIYVRNKIKAAKKVGMRTESYQFPSNIAEWDLLNVIDDLHDPNDDPADGIIIQLPLPAHLNKRTIINALDPVRDVDGFHPLNVGSLTLGHSQNAPCTPMGIMMLLEAAGMPLQGAHALVVGSSDIVGRPVATLLSQALATVTIAHKETRDLAAHCRQADIIVTAAGCPGLIRGQDIKPGAVIIDVGINRHADDGSLCGDVCFDECLGIASAITPVPGGVGPMTIACLLQNTLTAALTVSDYVPIVLATNS
jgi:methylenetetrahydrofolate dehydrogenase (NADP+)/methenyltetrahydrofolate cyclohydrolase